MKISRSVTMPVWIAWHCVAAVAIILIPSQLRTGKSFWSLDADHWLFLSGIAVTYLVFILVSAWRTRASRSISLTELVVGFLAVFGGYCIALLITESFYSRTLLGVALIMSTIFIALSFVLRPSSQKIALVIIAALAVSLQTLGSRPQEFLIQTLALGPKPQASKRVINTMLYSVRVSSFSHYFDVCPGEGEPCRKPGTGGGIERLPGGYLLSTGEGLLHYVTLDRESRTLRTRLLPHRIPINTDEFIANGLENPLNLFRVTDILVQDKGEIFSLFASHVFWKTSENCVVMRVSEAKVEYEPFLTGDTELEWRTLYETEPCLPAWKGSISGEHGGRMVLLGDGNLLLTVGHNDFDGVNREGRLPQDRSAAYGKTILIDPQTGVSELYSLGHRNPQGLYVDRDEVIWSTEHGPRGGDELNIIRRDTNYGWPLVSHGTQYGMHTWPLNAEPGRHDGFQLPVFAWVPSIAVSNLIAVQGKLFPLWQRDLLVASFKKALYRVRIRDGRVIYLESISIPGRIRDLLEDDDGQIVLYLDSGTIMFLRPTAEPNRAGDKSYVDDDARGQLLFAVCSGCHELADGNSHGIGPDLAGIVGRSIANAAGYDYSPALAKRQGTWTESKLDEFLKAPQRYAPGTTMMFEGMADPADRTALIRYLKTRR